MRALREQYDKRYVFEAQGLVELDDLTMQFVPESTMP